MKAIIGGKRYDTETATKIGEASSGYGTGDFKYWEETLYESPKGQYFLAGEGGAMTRWAEIQGDQKKGGSGIRLLTEPQAREWAEKYLSNAVVERHFEVEEG